MSSSCDPHEECYVLERILASFGAPVSEEQAWALCYGLVQCYVSIPKEDRNKLNLVTSLKHVILRTDGYLHQDTFVRSNGLSSTKTISEGKVVTELGVVLYRALDYGLGSDEERDLSPSLHRLIDLMTSAESERGETDDEGIERDSGDSEDEKDTSASFTLRDALQCCEEHIALSGTVGAEVGEHYRAVLRAFVAEAAALGSFLKRVADGTRFAIQSDLLSSEQDLHELQCEDWARLWKQVMRQLREGVKLKKVEYTRTPIEYALTPYEMLMEDIRARRYTLNKVMIDGDIPPRVKKDAHAIILDFIRSRPPLKKSSERKLPPSRKVSTPREILMESIRQEHRLKHVAIPARTRPVSMVASSHSVAGPLDSPQPKRKLIAAPRFNLSNEDEDDDDLSDIPPCSPKNGRVTIFSSVDVDLPRNAPGDSPTRSPVSRISYDLANYSSSGTPERRHSITLCETPASAPSSSSSSSPEVFASAKVSPTSLLSSSSKTQRDFLSSEFSSKLDCLSLTLEEVVHIRNVLTKADLEALPLDLTIKEDMAKGKICFLCMKTRFGFFAPRGNICRLCKRTVCKKCVSKMRIPTEHFSNVPVVMLTPVSISPKEEDEESSFIPKSFLSRLQDIPRSSGVSSERRSSISGSVGSAPSSPPSSRGSQGPASLPAQPPQCMANVIKRKQDMRQHKQQVEERLRGELMAVCLDCKAMVLHILLSIKVRREHSAVGQPDRGAGDAARNHLTLNITPVYN